MGKQSKQSGEGWQAHLPRVVRVGRSIFDPIWRQQEHQAGANELLHVVHGRMTLVTRKFKVAAREGDTLFVPTGTWHRDEFPATSIFEVYLIQFEWPAGQTTLESCDPTRFASLRPTTKAGMAHMIRELHHDWQQGGALMASLVGLRVAQMLLTAAREFAAPGQDQVLPPRSRSIMRDAQAFIRTHYHHPLTLEEIAEAVHVSPYHLSRVFSQEAGQTLSQYLTETRMSAAADLLRSRNQSVSEIAAAVGYRDAHYFGRVFRTIHGVTPSAFRRG